MTEVLYWLISQSAACPCNMRGEYLPPHTPAPPPPVPADGEALDSWSPLNSPVEFDFTQYHFSEAQSSASKIDKALDMWAATVMEFGGDAPWQDVADLYATIDVIQHGDSPWKVSKVKYQGPLPPGRPPKWMTQSYKFCTQDFRQILHHQLAMSQFSNMINLAPYRQFDGAGQWVWSNLMSADWS